MSGIAGLVRFDGRTVRPEQVRAMSEAISHRGPDGSRQWTDPSAGLAHCALHTTPEATHERQPLQCVESGVTLVADARIDNRDELIRRLSPGPQNGAVVTDADLILAAYKEWGGDCPVHLIGAFAFAVWDAREQRLLLACDHMALRTLFYYWTSEFVAFGTEIKALFHAEGVPRETNEAAIADHLTTVARREPHATFYEGIYQMPAAHRFLICRDRFRSRKYWQLDPNQRLEMDSEAEYVQGFRDYFREAVRCRLRGRGAVGSTLSGGLDSSSIACTACDLLRTTGQPLHTFSCIFPGLPEKELRFIDERPYIESVTETEGIEGHYVRADEFSPLVDVDRMLWHMDDGFWGGNTYLHWLMYRAANRNGIRVFFDGSDGDSTVSHGNGYLVELMYRERWDVFEREIDAISRLKEVSRQQLARQFGYRVLADHIENGRLGRFWRSMRVLNGRFDVPYREMSMGPGLRTVLPDEWRQRLDHLGGSRQSTGAPEALIAPDFAASQHVEHRLGSGFLSIDRKEAPEYANHRVSHLRGLSGAHFTGLLNLADKTAAAHQIEQRYPFFDRRLMEFCVSLPGSMKLNGGWGRYVMRKAMEGTLPEKIQWRRDKGLLGANLARNLWTHESERIEEMLTTGRSLISPYVNMSAVEKLVAECRATVEDRDRLGGSIQVMAPYMLWRWLEKERSER